MQKKSVEVCLATIPNTTHGSRPATLGAGGVMPLGDRIQRPLAAVLAEIPAELSRPSCLLTANVGAAINCPPCLAVRQTGVQLGFARGCPGRGRPKQGCYNCH